MKSIYDIRRKNLNEIIRRDFDDTQLRFAERVKRSQNLSEYDGREYAFNADEDRNPMGGSIYDGNSYTAIWPVAYLDLDGFKPINDRYGHAMGDQILVKLADKLAATARATDLVARLGGDEFAILCPKLQSEDDLEQFCARLLGAVAGIPSDDTPGCRLGGSIGIACYPRDGYALDHLLALADRAMYAAKNAGGHSWQVA